MEELEPRLRDLETKVALNKADIERVEQNSKNWWKEMGDDLKDVKHQLEILPDKIIERLDEKIDLKIKVSVSESENRTKRWLIGLLVSVVLLAIGVIIDLIIKR